MTAVSRSDGGRRALAGFLYQILGISGLRASVDLDESEAEDELDALVSLVRVSRLEHEGFDDAVIQSVVNGEAGISLVQFKHSGTIPPRTIFRAEYDEIIKALASSEERAEKQGHRVIGYYLITNRDVRASPESGPPEEEATDATGKTAGLKRKGRKTNTSSPLDSPRAYSPREVRIRGKLVLHPSITMERWTTILRRYAERLGCIEGEIDDGIDRLVGRILRGTASGDDVAIEDEDLIIAFTDCPTTRALTEEYRTEKSLEQISGLAEILHPGRPVPREVLDELSRRIQERAIIIVLGPGGSGKSTALVEWARQVVESQPPRPGVVTSVFPVSDIRPLLVTEIVCDWFGLHPTHHGRRTDTPEVSLDRLQVAVPGGVHPVLIVGLDGVDEGAGFAPREHVVREAVRWFRKEDDSAYREGRSPRATLIVTTRTEDSIENLLDLNISGFLPSGRRFDPIKVGDFTHRELLKAAEQDLGWSHGRIYSTLKGMGRLTELNAAYGTIPPPANSETGPEPPIDSEILESIHHPAMWRALINLDQEIAVRALEGEREAVAELARSFTKGWFCRKARRRQFDLLSPEAIVAVLGRVARAAPVGGEVFAYKPHWNDPACSVVGASAAWALYNEAISAGYVLEPTKSQWRWRHRFCVGYLRSIDDLD